MNTQKLLLGLAVLSLVGCEAVEAPSSVTAQSVEALPGIEGVLHVETIGDVPLPAGQAGGTWSDESRRLEGFELRFTAPLAGVGLEYRVNAHGTGDSGWITEHLYAGTRGEARPLLGMAVRLTGPNAGKYDVRYSCAFQGALAEQRRVFANGTWCAFDGRQVQGIKVWLAPHEAVACQLPSTTGDSCSGGWSYRVEPTCQKENGKVCALRKPCEVWQSSISFHASPAFVASQVEAVCAQFDLICWSKTLGTMLVDSKDRQCHDQAQAWVESRRAQVPEVPAREWIKLNSAHANLSTKRAGWRNWPYQQYLYDCAVDVTDVAPAVERSEICPCEQEVMTYRTETGTQCSPENDWQRMLSATKPEGERMKYPRCLSCEALPLPDRNEALEQARSKVEDKFECLKTSINSPATNYEPMKRQLRLLFERHGHLLHADKREELRALSPPTSELSCDTVEVANECVIPNATIRPRLRAC